MIPRPLVIFAVAVLVTGAPSARQQAFDLVIAGGRVIDPESGLDAARNIGITAGRIAAISSDRLTGRSTIDAAGRVVAPGFIDLHAHGQDRDGYRFQALDGVTSSFELEVGASDIDGWYAKRTAGQLINHGVSVGHIQVRMAVMKDPGTFLPTGSGAHGKATPADVKAIAAGIEAGLRRGAVSVGAGFPYTPAAAREELLEVFRVAGRYGATVHVHIRRGPAGLEEALALASEGKSAMHVVHLNSSGLAQTPRMIEMIVAARASGRDVTTEAYPYAAGMTEIKSANIDEYEKPDANLSALEWPPTGERLTRESFNRYRREGGPVITHTNTEPMVAAAINSPLTMIASDSYWENGTGHPRTTGTYSRVLGRYARPPGTLTLVDALRKMTLMPAQRLETRVPAMRNKGRLKPGADADVVVFDAGRVLDQSTYRDPSRPPLGIDHVIVNGVTVVANGKLVEGAAPGRPIRAPTRQD
jgi:N-acyl-D-aspartate/D-glutamate deacylase